MKLVAYHNHPTIKAIYLNRVREHRENDDLVKGQYWEDGKGCAVGCTIHGSDYSAYERELGVPIMLALLEDCIFEGLSNSDAQTWPERFLSAIEPGQDLSCVGWQFLHWLLTESGIGAFDHPRVCALVKQGADVLVPLTKGLPVDERAARRVAQSALDVVILDDATMLAVGSVENVAWSVAWSDDSLLAARRAWSATCRAVKSAARTVLHASSATLGVWGQEWEALGDAAASEASTVTESVAWSDESVLAARRAWCTAWQKMADKLITLIEAAPSET